MCTGIALAMSEIPIKIIEQYKLENRVFKRGGESEIRFFFSDSARYIPILHDGQFRIVPWGSTRHESRHLPVGGWITLSALKNCGFEGIKIPTEIPATMGFEKGVWFRIRQGIKGVVVRNERRQDVVYMLCEKSSHYFQVMTRSPRMPLLIDETY